MLGKKSGTTTSSREDLKKEKRGGEEVLKLTHHTSCLLFHVFLICMAPKRKGARSMREEGGAHQHFVVGCVSWQTSPAALLRKSSE